MGPTILTCSCLQFSPAKDFKILALALFAQIKFYFFDFSKIFFDSEDASKNVLFHYSGVSSWIFIILVSNWGFLGSRNSMVIVLGF